MFYEILNDGTIGRSTSSEKVAKSLNLNLYTEKKIVYGYDGRRYFDGEQPELPIELKQENIRHIRNDYLSDTDKYMIVDFPVSDDERDLCKVYRQYLRDYTQTPDWWESYPKTFEDWKE